MKILTNLLLVFFLSYAYSQVIGIDLGTEFWKASLISPGKNLVIVENSRSQRKSHNGIAFLEGIRHFEYDAFSKRQKKPKSTYFYLNKLIESLDFQEKLEGYTFENGTYYVTEGEDKLSLEQLVGMVMKNIKKYGSLQAGSDIKDAVLTVPAHWGFKSRLALVNAAYLADLSVLGLVNENSAAAIHFAITRNDSQAVNIGFFNLGSQNLQISIIQFFGTLDEAKNKNIQSIRVLSHVSVSDVGGLRVDREIAEHIATEFQAKHKIDPRKNEKSWVKLLHKCSDTKEVLSANKDAAVYIEGFIDGIDLHTHVKRETLQSSGIFAIIKEKMQEALDKAGITKDQLSSVQIIGGASRIPLVTKLVKDFYAPADVGSHINGDESMAFGSSLRAANLSIAFRVKQLHFYDGYPEQTKVVISNIQDGVVLQSDLFNKDSWQGQRKQIVVDESNEDLKATIFYGQDIIHQYIISNVSQWKEKYNETNYNFTEAPKTILTFISNSITVAELKEAYVNITLNTSTTKQVYELVVENDTDSNPEDKSQKAQQNNQQSKDNEEKLDQTKQENQEETKQSESNSTDKPKKKKEKTISVKRIVDDFKIQNKKLNLKHQTEFDRYKRYTKEQIEQYKQVIYKYEKHQNYLREKSKIRNDFQSALYALKDDFDNPGLKTFSTEAQIDKLKQSVSVELEWLEENAWTAEKVDFQRHYRSIQRVYNPIVNRSNQYKERQSTYNKTIEVLSLIYSKTVELNNSQPWVSQKAEAHLKKINETVQWLHSKLKEQVNRKLYEDVIFYNNQMIDKAEDLRDQYYLIKMIPRPKFTKKIVLEQASKKTAEQQVNLDDQPSPESKEQTSDQPSQNENEAEPDQSNEEEVKQDL